MNKLCCDGYWTRQVRKFSARTLEQVRRMTGVINKAKGIYCSDSALSDWKWHKEQSKQYLESTYIQNDSGQVFTLADVSKTT